MHDPLKSNRSSRLYSTLIGLYPAEHRERFGSEMLQTFSDQCREITHVNRYHFSTLIHWVILWVRTLVDILFNSVKEHLATPNSITGLLDPPGNAPLPWKGVFLVLLPGFIFFIGQVGQLSGVDWFFWLIYRGSYYLILPVIIVWAWKRRFPIWGLIPLGLFFQTLVDKVNRLQYVDTDSLPLSVFRLVLHFQKIYTDIRLGLIVAMVFISALLIWMMIRTYHTTKSAWFWFGGYLLAACAVTTVSSWSFMAAVYSDSLSGAPISVWIEDIKMIVGSSLYPYCAFLLVVSLGALASQRFGRLAMLMPMGYLMSAIIYGRVSNNWPEAGSGEFQLMLAVAVVALLYRFTVALAGPVWVVRSASPQSRKRAGLITLLVPVLFQAVFNLWIFIYYKWNFSLLGIFTSIIQNQVIFAIGIMLAVSTYMDNPDAKEPVPEGRLEQKKSSIAPQEN